VRQPRRPDARHQVPVAVFVVDRAAGSSVPGVPRMVKQAKGRCYRGALEAGIVITALETKATHAVAVQFELSLTQADTVNPAATSSS